MSNDLDLYQGGDLQPYAPEQPLAPVDWGNEDQLTNREIDTLERVGQQQPRDQQQQALTEIAAAISSDLMRLGHPQQLISAAVEWYRNNAPKQHVNVRAAHRYNLYSHQNDGMANSFANAMARVGASQEFVNNCLWLLEQLAARVQQNHVSHGKSAQGSATSDPTDQLTDEQYDAVLEANETAKANTLGYLKNLWGTSFHANLRVVGDYFAKLPARDQEHLNQFTNGWIAGTNTPEVMLGIYNMAIGTGTLPKSGAAIAQEIANIENVMKTNRGAYMKDEQLQARYRTLLDMRDD